MNEPTFVLSELRTGEELGAYVAWLERLREEGVTRARLVIRPHHEALPLAILWYDRMMTVAPRIGPPILRTRLEGGNTLSGLLIWLASSHGRTLAKDALVTVPHFLEYASPLHDRLVERLARYVIFTAADERLYGGNAAYRHARAVMLLSANRLLDRHDLRRHFGTVLE